MARYERVIQIHAAPHNVWPVMIDVDRWPEWSASMLSIVRDGSGPFGLGSTAKVAPKGTKAATWRVTQFDSGRSFTWETQYMPGLRVIAGHAIEPADGGTRTRLWITAGGALAPLFGGLIARMSRRNVDLEAEGLKRRSEGSITT